jgi:hypothetical protein
MFGNRKIGLVLQAKLEVSEPGDAYERQADAVAELVMRMPDGEATAIGNGPPQIQRKCSTCEEEDETLRFKRSPGAAPEVTPSVAANVDALRGGGQPLAPTARAFFEPRFGESFWPALGHGFVGFVNSNIANDATFSHELGHVLLDDGGHDVSAG